jgi:hypothetical protein
VVHITEEDALDAVQIALDNSLDRRLGRGIKLRLLLEELGLVPHAVVLFYNEIATPHPDMPKGYRVSDPIFKHTTKHDHTRSITDQSTTLSPSTSSSRRRMRI